MVIGRPTALNHRVVASIVAQKVLVALEALGRKFVGGARHGGIIDAELSSCQRTNPWRVVADVHT
jgi:hypothetical protein